VGRPAIQLVVEPVAPAADRLRDEQSGGQCVGEVDEGVSVPLAPDVGAYGADGDGTPDAQPAVPDAQCAHQVAPLAEVRPGAAHDVVEPPTDDPEDDRPRGHVVDLLTGAATRSQPVPGH